MGGKKYAFQLSREGMEKRDVEAIALVVQRFINDGYQVFGFHTKVKYLKKIILLDGQCMPGLEVPMHRCLSGLITSKAFFPTSPAQKQKVAWILK